MLLTSSAWAQTYITPEEQYKELIRVDQDIQPLGEHPFGEDVGLYKGSLSFHVTDVSASGTGPLLQLIRSFKMKPAFGSPAKTAQPIFADWSLDLPRIQTFAVSNGFVYDPSKGYDTSFSGWRVGVSSPLRCEDFQTPPWTIDVGLFTGRTPSSFDISSWWTGYHLVIPGQGDQDLLGNADAATQGTYPAVTKNHWRLSCIQETQTANGEPGDGFVAHAPDGTTYYFNELLYRVAPGLPGSRSVVSVDPDTTKGLLNELGKPKVLFADAFALLTGSKAAHAAASGAPSLAREMAYLLVTKIEDRFGNSLVYHYNGSGFLTSITASDGRALEITYGGPEGQVASVKLQPTSGSPRTWTYTYAVVNSGTRSGAVTSLNKVTLPDGSQWHYQFADFDGLPSLVAAPGQGTCNTVGAPSYVDSATGTITGPSGLTGTFTIKPMMHARSYVTNGCGGLHGGVTPDSPGSWAIIPKAWYDYTITQHTLSGAGVTLRTWTYQYSTPNPSWANCTGSCSSTEWVKVTRPDGSVVKHTFSNKFDVTESHLLRTDFYASASATTPLRSVVNTYAAPTMPSLPTSAGTLLTPRINTQQATEYSPLSKRIIKQNGDSYTWQAEAFDQYAHVTEDERFNSIAGQKTIKEQTTYRNDATHWILGLPLTVENLATGETVSQYTYDSTKNLPTARAHFGQTVMHYTWNSAGQLASFTDANGHKTTLSSYKRGIPQAIGYPDGTSQHLDVDDFGQISSITNQAGNTTHYAYNAIGRLTKIAYPGSWHPKTFAYTYVTSSERDIGAGHWKRTVSQGDARRVTYYSALLRPILTDTYIAGDDNSHISAKKVYNWKGLTTFASWPKQGSLSLSALTAGTTTTYDALGRLTSVSQPSDLGKLTTTTAYLSGARKKVTDPAGHVTTTSYQVFGEPNYKAVTRVQAPGGIVQTITRNLYGQPVTITQSGPDGQGGVVSVTKLLYHNLRHRLCRIEEPETGSTVMGYDAVGNLIWNAEGQVVSGDGCGSEPASHTARAYDAMNRLKTVSYPDGQGNTTTAYNAVGRISSTQANTASGPVLWTYVYDTLDHLTGETLDVDGYSWPMHYAYDANGALSKVTYPNDKSVAYAPDALGRPTQAGTYATGASYFPDGTLEHFTYMDGMQYLIERNTRHLLKNLTYATASTLNISQDYSYDKDANLTSVDDLVGQNDKTLSYDALNRLTEAKASGLWGTVSYGYDALNNLRRLTGDGLVHTYHYGAANRLISIASGSTMLHSFAYDPSGDITQMDSQARNFDAAHRLLEIPGKASYVYDATGRRVKASDADGHATYSLYSRAGRLMYQWNTIGGAKTDYVYLGKKLIAEVATSPLPPASAPSVSAPATDSDGNYTVSWNSVDTATSYTLQEQTGGGSWSTVYSGSNLSQTETGKGNGSYGYRAKACNAGGCSGWSSTQTVVVTHSPGSAPSLTVPTSSHDGVYTVSWGEVSTATSYTLQEQTSGGSWSTVYSGSSLSQAESGKGNGSYGYRVQACNAGGCGNWSAIQTVTVLLSPTTPNSFSVPSADSDGNYTVSWSSVGTATSYTLQEQTNGGSWATAYSGGSLNKAESGKGNGSYGYRIQACNAAGCSDWSAVKTVVVTHPPSGTSRMIVPSVSSTGSYVVDWTGVAGRTYYNLQININGGGWTQLYVSHGEVWNAHNQSNGTYGYRAQACNAGGCGPWSATGTVIVAHPPTSAPRMIVPSTNSTGSYVVDWTGVAGRTYYNLQIKINGGGWTQLYVSHGEVWNAHNQSGGTYGYRAQACNPGGCGPWSATGTVKVTLIPPVPSNVHIYERGNYKFIYQYLEWDAVSTATYYEVIAGGQLVNVGTATSYRIGGYPVQGLPTDASGSVRACNTHGCSAWVEAGI